MRVALTDEQPLNTQKGAPLALVDDYMQCVATRMLEMQITPTPEHDEFPSQSAATGECPVEPRIQNDEKGKENDHSTPSSLFGPISEETIRLTTGGHYIALKNRLEYAMLLPNGILDVRKWPATFVHDILQFPGTLAQIMGRNSQMDIVERMTPALLQGYRAIVHPITNMPCLMASQDPNDSVRGLIIFGQGKHERSCVNEHYQQRGARRVKDAVLVEALVPQPRSSRPVGGDRWRNQCTRIPANIWIWAGYDAGELIQVGARTWTLEGFMSGAYSETVQMC